MCDRKSCSSCPYLEQQRMMAGAVAMLLFERLVAARGRKLIEDQYIPVNAPSMKIELQNMLSECMMKMGAGVAFDLDDKMDDYQLERIIRALIDGFEPVKDVMES